MVRTICICGAGTMGSGIAQLTAHAGFKTIVFDVKVDSVEKSKEGILKNLQTLVDKGRVSEAEKTVTFDNISFTTNYEDCRADLIIEAIIENKKAKIDLFKKLQPLNNDDTIFATNTSSLSINSIGSELLNGKMFAGMHFFNPATLMKLVEVVKGEETSKEVIQQLCELCRRLGKTPVVCKDVPGFIVNRVARPYYLEAMKLVEEGVADFETIDNIMEASGFKMGPFKLMDLIGIDINFGVSNIVWEALGKPGRLTPSPLQKEKVDASNLGKKTGKGFYNY